MNNCNSGTIKIQKRKKFITEHDDIREKGNGEFSGKARRKLKRILVTEKNMILKKIGKLKQFRLL